MRGLYSEPASALEMRENLRVLSGAVDQVYDRHELWDTNAALATATHGTVGPAGSVVPAIIMAPGVLSVARWTFSVLPRHQKSTLRLTFYYSSPVGSTNNFSLTWGVDAHYPSGILSTKTVVGAPGAVNYAGPGTADHLVSGTVLFTTPYSSATHLFLKVGLNRAAVDANANNFAFVYGLLEVLAA